MWMTILLVCKCDSDDQKMLKTCIIKSWKCYTSTFPQKGNCVLLKLMVQIKKNFSHQWGKL